jgi:hypothetical protein
MVYDIRAKRTVKKIKRKKKGKENNSRRIVDNVCSMAGKNYNKHEKVVIEAMKKLGIKGNYKDHVVFILDQLIDRYGQYTVPRENKEGNEFIVIHKSKIGKIAGKEWGDKFWDFEWNKRTLFGHENVTSGVEIG